MHTDPKQGSSAGGMGSAGCLTTSGLEKKPINQTLDYTQILSIRLKTGERCIKNAAYSGMSLVLDVDFLISEQKSRNQDLVFLGTAFF